MSERRSVIRTWWPAIPCALSVGFFLMWVFDVGHGPFSGERFGTAGEWASAVGTTAAVAISLSILLADRRKARLQERVAEIERLANKVFANRPHSDQSLREIPVVWSMTEIGPAGSDPTKTKYELSFDLLNGSATPLLNLSARVELTGDWTGHDHTAWTDAMRALQEAGDDSGLRMWVAEYPYPVKVCEQSLVTAGERLTRVIEVDISTDRVQSASSFVVTWEIGALEFSHRVRRDGRPSRTTRPILESRRPHTS